MCVPSAFGGCWLTDRWPREFGEHKFKTYIDWMKSCSLISGLDLPALSVPCGLTAAGTSVLGTGRAVWHSIVQRS